MAHPNQIQIIIVICCWTGKTSRPNLCVQVYISGYFHVKTTGSFGQQTIYIDFMYLIFMFFLAHYFCVGATSGLWSPLLSRWKEKGMKGDTGSSLLNLLWVLTWFSRPKNGVLRLMDKGMLRKWHQLYASRELPWVGLRCIDHVVLSEWCDVAF